MKFDVPPVIINKLFEEGFEEQILDIVMVFENDGMREVSDIPISPSTIGDFNGEKVIISEKVFSIYKGLVERINNPNTSEEIPFFLLGNRQVMEGQSYVIFDNIIYD